MENKNTNNRTGEKKHSFPVKNTRPSAIKTEGPTITSIVVHKEETTARSFTVPLYPAKCSFFKLGIQKEKFYRNYIPISFREMTVVGRIFRGDHGTDYLECKFPEPIKGQFEYPCAFTIERKGENIYKMSTAKDREIESEQKQTKTKASNEQKSATTQKRYPFPSQKTVRR